MSTRRKRPRGDTTLAVARGLGWFSIGLGVAELVAPRAMARNLGLRDNATLVAGYGAREIATGIGILTQDDPTPWMWGRVGGDALDLATLGAGLTDSSTEHDRVGLAIGAVAGVTVLDVICAQSLTQEKQELQRLSRRQYDYSRRSGFKVSPDEARGAARDFEVPGDMRIPEPLRPYNTSASP